MVLIARFHLKRCALFSKWYCFTFPSFNRISPADTPIFSQYSTVFLWNALSRCLPEIADTARLHSETSLLVNPSGLLTLMLGRCRRRWPNIKPTLVQRLVFAVWAAAWPLYTNMQCEAPQDICPTSQPAPEIIYLLSIMDIVGNLL